MNGRFSFIVKIVVAMTIVVGAFVASIAALRRFDFYGFQSNSKIGWISKVEGVVQVKSGDLDFRPVRTGTSLADGDQIVTGPDSSAGINFYSGRTADCRANSRITIASLEDAASSPTILIDATRAGQTQVSLGNAESRPVILLTGNGAITVSAGESVTTKSTGAAGITEVVKKNIKTGKTTTLTKVEAVESGRMIEQALAAVATPAPTLIPTPTSTPIPTPKPQPKIMATASLLFPAPGKTLWTSAAFTSISATELTIKVSLKSNIDPTKIAVELKQGPKDKGVVIPLTPTGESNSFAGKTSIGSLIESGAGKSRNGATIHSFDASIIFAVSQTARRIPIEGGFSIGSLSPLGQAASVTVGLQDLIERPVIGPWIAGTTGGNPGKFPLVLTTVKAGVIRPFLGMMRSATQSGFDAPATLRPSGTFLVKDQEVIAEISGGALNNANSDRLREILDADFAFTGPRDALVNGKKYSVEQIQSLVAGSLQNGKSIFVFQDQNLFQVNADFVRKYPSVASFVRKNSSAFFTRPVKINSFR